jgi:hypothetical protein
MLDISLSDAAFRFHTASGYKGPPSAGDVPARHDPTANLRHEEHDLADVSETEGTWPTPLGKSVDGGRNTAAA